MNPNKRNPGVELSSSEDSSEESSVDDSCSEDSSLYLSGSFG